MEGIWEVGREGGREDGRETGRKEYLQGDDTAAVKENHSIISICNLSIRKINLVWVLVCRTRSSSQFSMLLADWIYHKMNTHSLMHPSFYSPITSPSLPSVHRTP